MFDVHALVATWDQEAVLNHLDDLLLGRDIRQTLHARRINRTARRLGREVGTGRTTVDAAERRLEHLVHELDPETPVELHLLPLDEGKAIARAAFAAGLKQGQRALRRAVA